MKGIVQDLKTAEAADALIIIDRILELSRWHLGDPIATEPNFVPPPRLLRVSDRH